MTASLWRIVGVLLLGLVPLLSGCQPIQAPPEVAVASTSDVVRGAYGQWDLALIPSYALAEDESAELAGYVNPQAMVTSGWLAANLDNPRVRLLDVRRPIGAANFAMAHIPQAQHVDLWLDLMERDPNQPMMDLIGPDRFAGLMSRLGVANDSTVIVYDAGEGTSAATLWWAMRRYGHEDVRLLNGGLVKWLMEGRETTSRVPTFEPTTYIIDEQPQLLAKLDDVKQAMADPTIFIVDARPFGYFTGDIAHAATPTIGHIPGALSMPAPWQLTPEQKTILPAEQLAMTFDLMEITPAQRGITYCGNGHLAAFDAFLLYLMGFEDVAVYDSSWTEYGVMPELPTETGCNQGLGL